MNKSILENNDIIEQRAKDFMVKLREDKYGKNSRPQLARELSTLLGRPVPVTTYAGYETGRNAPVDVKIALTRIYSVPFWMISGLKYNPDD